MADFNTFPEGVEGLEYYDAAYYTRWRYAGGQWNRIEVGAPNETLYTNAKYLYLGPPGANGDPIYDADVLLTKGFDPNLALAVPAAIDNQAQFNNWVHEQLDNESNVEGLQLQIDRNRNFSINTDTNLNILQNTASSGVWVNEAGTPPDAQRFFMAKDNGDRTNAFPLVTTITVNYVGGGDFLFDRYTEVGDIILVQDTDGRGFGSYLVEDYTEVNKDDPELSARYIIYDVSPFGEQDAYGEIADGNFAQIRIIHPRFPTDEEVEALYVKKAGDTVTGELTFVGDQSLSFQGSTTQEITAFDDDSDGDRLTMQLRGDTSFAVTGRTGANLVTIESDGSEVRFNAPIYVEPTANFANNVELSLDVNKRFRAKEKGSGQTIFEILGTKEKGVIYNGVTSTNNHITTKKFTDDTYLNKTQDDTINGKILSFKRLEEAGFWNYIRFETPTAWHSSNSNHGAIIQIGTTNSFKQQLKIQGRSNKDLFKIYDDGQAQATFYGNLNATNAIKVGGNEVATKEYVDSQIGGETGPDFSFDGNRTCVGIGTGSTFLNPGECIFLNDQLASTIDANELRAIGLPEEGEMDWDKCSRTGIIRIKNGSTLVGYFQVWDLAGSAGRQKHLKGKMLQVENKALPSFTTGTPLYFNGVFFK